MLFGSSGIRRKFDHTLIDLALKVGSALANRSSEIVVGMDTRTTGPLLQNALVSGILGSGGTAYIAGIAPTPSIAYATRAAKSGCMITASHNPEEYNGIKLFNPDGSSFSSSQQQEMEEMLKKFYWTDWKNQGIRKQADVIAPHKNAILDAVNIESEIKVVVDCGNGAGCMMTPGLLSDAGVKTSLYKL